MTDSNNEKYSTVLRIPLINAAALQNDPEIQEFLLRAGADPESQRIVIRLSGIPEENQVLAEAKTKDECCRLMCELKEILINKGYYAKNDDEGERI